MMQDDDAGNPTIPTITKLTTLQRQKIRNQLKFVMFLILMKNARI